MQLCNIIKTGVKRKEEITINNMNDELKITYDIDMDECNKLLETQYYKKFDLFDLEEHLLRGIIDIKFNNTHFNFEAGIPEFFNDLLEDLHILKNGCKKRELEDIMYQEYNFILKSINQRKVVIIGTFRNKEWKKDLTSELDISINKLKSSILQLRPQIITDIKKIYPEYTSIRHFPELISRLTS